MSERSEGGQRRKRSGLKLYNIFKQVGVAAARFASRSRPLAKAYIGFLSAASRLVDDSNVALRIANSTTHATWPSLSLRSRRVTVGGIPLLVHPHLGEFDQEALFATRLSYEPETFEWLKQHANRYETVIEIGANVGIFTVYLDKLSAQSGSSRLRNIYAFEPSPEAYRRLNANLLANNCKLVTAVQAAIADCPGFLPFYEPQGHLTNGSFNRTFAEIFSRDISERLVLAIAANDLDPLFKGKVLLKLDVESYEPTLLKALSRVIEMHKPDIIVEVLNETAEAIEAIDCLGRYQRFLLSNPPKGHLRIFADQSVRDWLLIPAEASN